MGLLAVGADPFARPSGLELAATHQAMTDFGNVDFVTLGLLVRLFTISGHGASPT